MALLRVMSRAAQMLLKQEQEHSSISVSRKGSNLAELLNELKACSSTANLTRGKSIHDSAMQTGDDSNVYVANTLINMYGKCGSLEEARKVFDGMQVRTEVSWTALILGYADNGDSDVALDLFLTMWSEGYEASARTFVAVLKVCIVLAAKEDGSPLKVRSRQRGRAVHLLASSSGCDCNMYVQGTLVDMYSKCRSMADTGMVFDRMLHVTVVTMNSLILGYADNGQGETALDYFLDMERYGCAPNARTLVAAIRACTDIASREGDKLRQSRERGRAVHLLASATCDSDLYLESALVDMYANVGSMTDAQEVFDRMRYHDVVSWNALLLGYADNGEGELGLVMFARMRVERCTPNARTFLAAVKACTDVAVKEAGYEELVKENSRGRGRALHLLASCAGCDLHLFVGSALVDMYSKCASMQDARRIFDAMKHLDVVSWTTLMLGYADNGEGNAVLDLFSRMKREGHEPDSFAFVAVLKASGMLGALDFGRAVHVEIHSRGLENVPVLTNCLVDFYVKCGNLAEAEQVFDSHGRKDLVTWNALMAGYSRLGDTRGMFDLFSRIRHGDLRPDATTFSIILAACSHAGLVDEGKAYFKAMSAEFGIKPDVEHCTSMIDILGRANDLDDAMCLLRGMPFDPNAVTWTAVLGACRKWRNAGLGRLAFEALMCLDDRSAGGYVLMAGTEIERRTC